MKRMKRMIFLLIALAMIVFTSCTEQNSSNTNKVFQPTELFSEPSRPAGQ